MKIKKHIKPNMKKIAFSLVFFAAALAMHAQSWTNRFHASPDGDDWAFGVATDGTGNVIVTGTIGIGGASTEYATIKYSGAGIPLWTNFYPGLPDEHAEARALAVNTNGDVFVTGFTEPEVWWPGTTVGDYVTINYSSAGVPLWTNRYDGPDSNLDFAGKVVVDVFGNVVVTGTSYGNNSFEDWATVKYSSAGDLLWSQRFQGPGMSQDQAGLLAVDNAGNVFVSGGTEVYVPDLGGNWIERLTIKYSGDGVALWTNPYPIGWETSVVAVDGNGTVFAAGDDRARRGWTNGSDLVTIKYSGGTVPVWTNYYGRPGQDWENPLALALDRNGNVIVTERSGDDFLTLKYSNDGVAQWTNRCPVNGVESGSLAVDRDGNVFVAGTAGISGGSNDWVTIKYSAAGTALWTNRYNGPANGEDTVRGITADGSGNVFVTGRSWNGTHYDWLTIKYAAEVAPPLLGIQRLGNNVVLSWTNAAFGLQSAPAITGTFTNVPGASSPYTNLITGGQRLFRLVQ